MANHQAQLNQQYGKYFGYGSGTQYDSSTAQNKWGSAANTGNQTQLSQTQSQYQAAPQSYGTAAAATATGSGYGYGNVYGQQQNYAGTGSSDSSVSASTFTGNKSTSSFNNANSTSTTQSTGFGSSTNTATGMGLNSYQTNFVSAGFNNNTTGNLNASNQVSGMGYGSATPNMFGSNQDTSMNSTMTCIANSNVTNTLTSNMTNNAATAATNQVQSFGNTTGDTMNQFNPMNQMFGTATNFEASGDATSTTGVNYSSGFNEGFNSGMMTLLQQSLLQQANSGSGYGNFGTATGNTWGTSDGSGGYYAPPMDSSTPNITSTTAGSGTGTKQWNNNKGTKWSGKDNKQDFYGNRFSQMYTGVPGVWGQAQTGAGRGKRLMDGVRVNAKGEKVISVEIPLHLYSRWGQLRKIFSRQDTEVAKHLIESHDQKCEEKECVARDHGKNLKLKKKNKQPQDTEKAETGHEEEEVEMTEEDLMLQQIMGFGNFNTPKEAMEKSKKGGATACVSDSDTTVKSAASGSWELTAGFIGPQTTEKQEKKPEKKLSDPEPQSGAGALSKEEKEAMAKLGWSVFNNKKNSKGGENDDDDDDDNDDNDDDEGKMDDGDKGAAAAK